MSANNTEQETIRRIASRIADRLTEQPPATESSDVKLNEDIAATLTSLNTNLHKIERRLARLEANHIHDENRAPANDISVDARRRNGNAAIVHPSMERFGVGEAVSELVDHFEREKTCDLDPTGKPCDHCAMCSSRGF